MLKECSLKKKAETWVSRKKDVTLRDKITSVGIKVLTAPTSQDRTHARVFKEGNIEWTPLERAIGGKNLSVT